MQATYSRATPEREGLNFPVPVAAGQLLLAGTLVFITTDGFATNTAAANQICLGTVDIDVDNRLGANGDAHVVVRRARHFLLNNDPADPVMQSNLGEPIYASDNQTLAASDGGGVRSIAGTFVGFDTENPAMVWLEIR